MRCPFCNNTKIKVIDKRPSDEQTIRRRRECLKCKKRFTTYERADFDISVVKRDGRREPFNRNKLKIGLMKACEKRPISLRMIEKMVDDVETKLRENFGPEVKSSVIGDIVMEKLRDIDEVAYVRFASYYKQFKDIKSFEKELKELRKKQ
ncbi:MAG: transcriptional regulator NrdR [Candidatus Aenigmatarchaeota archaeon]